MHAFRRAALSSALAASRAIAPKAQSTSFVRYLARNSAPKATTIQATRAFSQTFRLANAEQQPPAETAEAAAEAAEATEAAETTSAVATEAAQTEVTAAEEGTPNGVFVRNILFDATEEHLEEIFGEYGELESVVIARDARGLSRGYAFVYFKTAEAMNEAIAKADGSFWHGRRLNVQARRDRIKQLKENRGPPKTPTSSLYIGNIPYETTDAELNRLFDKIPNLVDVRVAIDRATGWPRGFAHADFASVEAAELAAKRLQGAQLGMRDLRIDFAQQNKGGRRPGNSQGYRRDESSRY